MSKNRIKTKNNYAPIFQDSSLTYNYDLVTTISDLINTGEINEAKKLLSSLSKSVAGHHPLYPYYSTGIEDKNGKLTFASKPNSSEALKKYPPKYKGIITIPEKYKNFSSMTELLEYSYSNQEDIEVNVKEVRKLLGDLTDPYQDDIFTPENLKKMIFKIKHKDFPPARPFKIVFEDSDYTIDYLLLRVEKIISDEEIILGNLEQNTELYIKIQSNILNNKFDFNIKVNEKYERDVSANLAFINFIINCTDEIEVKIISLDTSDIFIAATLSNVNFESIFKDMEQEKRFLESLQVIEDYYNRKIVLPDIISEDDITNAIILSKGIRHKKVKGRFDDFNAKFNITDELKDYILNHKRDVFPIEYEVLDASINIFNETFKITKVIRRFNNLKLQDEQKIIRKLEVLEEGDQINIKFIPADEKENEYEDEFYFG